MGEEDTRAAGAQRRPDAAARRRGHPGRPPARARSRTRSTRRCATGSPTSTTTHYLFGTVAGPAPVPGDGPRLPAGHRRRGPRAGARARPAGCPTRSLACVGGGSNAIGIFHAFLDDAGVRLVGFEAGGDGVETGRHAATHHRRRAGRAARRPLLPAAGRRRPDHRVALDLGRPGLPRRRPGARLPARHRPGRVPAGHRRRGDGGVRAALPHRGHHPGDRVRARPGRRAASSASELGPGRAASWSTSPAAATRTSTPRRAGSASATARTSTRARPGHRPAARPRARSTRGDAAPDAGETA